MTFTPHTINPQLDLELVREVSVAPELVWKAWTTPELIVQWFTPKPWQTTGCELDLRPGGIFRTEMRGPDGEAGGGDGCVLEVVPNERFVWTAALGAGYRPEPGDLPFTAIIELEPTASGGTRYRAIAVHGVPEAAAAHDEMGFTHGWAAALDQLVELMSPT